MEGRIDPIGTNPLTPGAPVPHVHRRTEEERELFRRALQEREQDAPSEDEEDEPVKRAPEMGERAPDEAGGQLDLLG